MMTITEKEQRIAEAVGLKNIRLIQYGSGAVLVHGDEIGNTGYFASVPRYFKSLEAMHEAENALTEEQYSRYAWSVLQGTPKHEVECKEFFSATAAQRAEALGRALNLWTE